MSQSLITTFLLLSVLLFVAANAFSLFGHKNRKRHGNDDNFANDDGYDDDAGFDDDNNGGGGGDDFGDPKNATGFPPECDPDVFGRLDPPITLILTMRMHDFNDTHPDMEESIADDRGIIGSMLGPDQRPVYLLDGPSNTISGPDSFSQWYQDVPGINLPIDVNITLQQTGDNNGHALYTFDSSDFFPLDNRGFGNQGRPHNYHMTGYAVVEFVYLEGSHQMLTFRGDDDMFIFIGGHLVVDLGGVHPPESKTIELDILRQQLSLVNNTVYPMHIFWAERHTVKSHFRIETTIQFISCPSLTPIPSTTSTTSLSPTSSHSKTPSASSTTTVTPSATSPPTNTPSSTLSQTNTPSSSTTSPSTNTPSSTTTAQPSNTPSSSTTALSSNTPSASATPTRTSVATTTPNPSCSSFPSADPTSEPSVTPSSTLSSSNTPSSTLSSSNTPSSTLSSSNTPSSSPSRTPDATSQLPTGSQTPSSVPSNTVPPTCSSKPSDSSTPTPSNTPPSTVPPSCSPKPSDSSTPTPSITPPIVVPSSCSSKPSDSSTPTPSITPLSTVSSGPSGSNTPAPNNTPPSTVSSKPSDSSTPTPSINDDDGVLVGIIVGSVLGGALILACLALALWWLLLGRAGTEQSPIIHPPVYVIAGADSRVDSGLYAVEWSALDEAF